MRKLIVRCALPCIFLLSCSIGSILPTSSYVRPTPTIMNCGQTMNSDLEMNLITRINKERTDHGLRALTVQPALITAARGHSADMACNNIISSTGTDGSTWHEWMVGAGYLVSYGQVNTFAGSDDPSAVLAGVTSSEPASQNILDPKVVDLGVGYAQRDGTKYKSYWTILMAIPSAFNNLPK